MSRSYQDPHALSSPALESLLDFVRDCRQRGADVSFSEFEHDLRERMSAVEREIVAEQLACYDVDSDRIEVSGATFRRKGRAKRRYCALSGEFEVYRNTYVPTGGGRAICPMELRAGIIESRFTPRAALVMSQAVAISTPKEANALFSELGGMQPSTSALDRLPKNLSKMWESKRETFECLLREAEVVSAESASVAISIDGVHVPMKDCGRTEKRNVEGKRPQGPAGFREVSCGTISLLDEDGARLQTVRYARQPEKNKATVKAQVEAELESILAVRPDLTVVALADGARENWAYFEELAERQGIEVIPTVDFYHVCERLKLAMDARYGEQTPESRARFEQFRVLLAEDENGAEKVIRALNARRAKVTGWRRKTIEAQLKYFRRYRHKMRYKELSDRNLPIGSGVVEAACKTLASSRLKRSGMAWGLDGMQAILTLRSLQQSDRWQEGWRLLEEEYRAEIHPVRRVA